MVRTIIDYRLRRLPPIRQVSIKVTGTPIEKPYGLEKYDVISIGKSTVYWSNYLYEGELQSLYLRDFYSWSGRISKPNFRALALVVLGLSIVTLFIPGVLAALYCHGRRRRYLDCDVLEVTKLLATPVYWIGFSFLGALMVLLVVNRARDTGHPSWKFFIPFYNLLLLFFGPSSRL